MTFREFLNGLNQLAKEHPESLDLQVISSKDDEGNGYNQVHYGPQVCNFDGDDISKSGTPNAVLVN